MNDTIYRQAVIDAIVAWTVEDRPDIEMPTDLVGRINALPSAQPEIIYCKHCRKYNKSPKDQEDYCPLYYYRGMPFGDEYDLEFCSYAEKRTDD